MLLTEPCFKEELSLALIDVICYYIFFAFLMPKTLTNMFTLNNIYMGIFCIINETILILLSYSFVATTQQPTTPFGKRKQPITKDDVACKRKLSYQHNQY